MSAILKTPQSLSGSDQSTAFLRQSADAARKRGELRLAELLHREISGRYPEEASNRPLASAPGTAAPVSTIQREACVDLTVLMRRATTLHALGRSTEALSICESAISAAPRSADAYFLRGSILRASGLFEAALGSFETALTLSDDPRTAFALATLYLLTGDLERGWPLYEQFHGAEKSQVRVQRRGDVAPGWGGDDLYGKVLHLYQDQDVKATVQFARYALLAQGKGATVVLSVEEPLRRLLQSLSPRVQIRTDDAQPVSCDYQCALSALPGLLGTVSESIPAESRYLHADTACLADWRKRLGAEGFKIGVCWKNEDLETDSSRSFPVDLLEPVSKVAGVRLISLQSRISAGELPAEMAIEIFGSDCGYGSDAFMEKAALIECLDLVITCDSTIAHLAGALGTKTWVALSRVPDWPWLLERRDSPWYPPLRLFRQSTGRDFDAVMDAIGAELRALLEMPDRAIAPARAATAILEVSEIAQIAPVDRSCAASKILDIVSSPQDRSPLLMPRGLAPHLVSGALVALLCAEIIHAAKVVLPHDASPQAGATSSSSGPRPRMDVEPIVAAHLFGRAVQAQDQSGSVAADLKLTATLATDDASQGMAIIGDNAGTSKVYSVGQIIGDVSLQAVYRDHVVIERSGEMVSLDLPRNKSDGLPGVVTLWPDAKAALPIDKFAESNLERDASGNLVGLRVAPGKDRAAFARSGLAGDDIVIAMNGQKLDPEMGVDFWKLASTGTTVTVLRRGEQRDVRLDLSGQEP